MLQAVLHLPPVPTTPLSTRMADALSQRPRLPVPGSLSNNVTLSKTRTACSQTDGGPFVPMRMRTDLAESGILSGIAAMPLHIFNDRHSS